MLAGPAVSTTKQTRVNNSGIKTSEKGTPQTGSHQIYYNRPLPGIAYVQCLGRLGNPGGLGEAGCVDALISTLLVSAELAVSGECMCR